MSFMKSGCFAGIGSRKSPPDILATMEEIGRLLALKGLTLRSGHAPGADQAFERGVISAGGKHEIYIPCPGFEGSRSKLFEIGPEAIELAERMHPAWSRLTDFDRKLQARNGYQVLGPFLSLYSDFIVCWTSGGKITGGTGQALRIAQAYSIRVYNLFFLKSFEELERDFNIKIEARPRVSQLSLF